MTDTRWWKYVTATAGNVQNTDIADRVGIDKSNVTRWSKGSRPAVEFVLKFARAYGQPVVAALAEAEYITDREAGIREVMVGVADLSEAELAEELLQRIRAREESSNVVVGRFGKTGAQTPAHLRAAKSRSRSRGEDQGE